MTPCFWRARLISKGPWIGVKTLLAGPIIDGEEQDRSPRWQAIVRLETTGRAILFGEPCPIEIDGMTLRSIERIEESEYQFLVGHADWAVKHAPHMPDATPKKAANVRGKSVW